MSTFLELPPVGENVFLFTHLVVREDAHMLYGFGSEEERSLFRMLLKISGVGAKMGLAILSTMSVDDFRRCVEYEDAATLVKIAVQVNGKLRGTVEAPAGAGQEDVEALARAQENVTRHLDGTTVRRVIYVPNRLLNFVVG